MKVSSDEIDFTEEIAKCKQQLQQKRNEEQILNDKVAHLLSQNADIGRHVSRVLHRTRTRATLIESDANQLRAHLQHASTCAENVSSKVRELDGAKCRIVDCLQRVDDLLDLRVCTDGVQTAMQQEDYERAAQHVHRFLTLDAQLFVMTPTAHDTKPDDSHSLKHSYDVLNEAKTKLTKIINSNFDDAVSKDDAGSVQRYFKLFPLLNEHEVGIRKIGAYLKGKINTATNKNFEVLTGGKQDVVRNSVIYADALTMLFEGAARVIEIHQPLVIAYYGQAYMLLLVECLQAGCDEQCARICDAFIEQRQLANKVRAVRRVTQRMSKKSPMHVSASAGIDGDTDPLHVDELLSEMTLMQTRAAMYARFVRRKVIPPPDAAASAKTPSAKDDADLEQRRHRLDALLVQSVVSRRMQELMGDYVALEEYYMDACLRKAMQMYGLTAPPKTGSSAEQHWTGDGVVAGGDDTDQSTSSQALVDDVLYVLRKWCVRAHVRVIATRVLSVRRALNSDNVDCVCAVMNNAATMLDTTYIDALQQRIFKTSTSAGGSLASAMSSSAALAYTNIQQASKIIAQPITGTGASDQSPSNIVLIWTLNCARYSIDGCALLRNKLIGDIQSSMPHLQPAEQAKVDFGLSQLEDVCRKLRTVCTSGLAHLCSTSVAPALSMALNAYTDYTHAPSEQEYAHMEVNEPFIDALLADLDRTLAAHQTLLTADENYNEFVGLVTQELARGLEKQIMSCTYNRLGGMQLEREVRALSTYLTSVGGWTVRERLARLDRIAALLNVNNVQEAQELAAAAAAEDVGAAHRMSRSEMNKFLRLRIDLPRKTG